MPCQLFEKFSSVYFFMISSKGNEYYQVTSNTYLVHLTKTVVDQTLGVDWNLDVNMFLFINISLISVHSLGEHFQ